MAPDDPSGPQPGAVPPAAEDLGCRPFDADDHYYRALDAFTRHMGADRVVFGSDWPHTERVPEPFDCPAELKGFSDGDRRAIMLDDVAHPNEPQPT